MTLTSTRLLARLGTAAALALLLAAPSLATDVTMEFDSDNFTTPLDIDNQFLAFDDGATFTYKAETSDGCEWSVVTVTGDTKDISVPGEDTLTVRVVTDFEYEDEDCEGIADDELAEKTSDWFGQDDDGNVWYFGEDSRECEEGVCPSEPGEGSWEAGVDGALPGIIMLGDPDSGERYRQEFAEDVALDWAMVMNLNGMPVLKLDDAVEPGEWENCLVTKEWNELEPGSVEQKTYCPEVGLVLVEEHRGALVRVELVEPETEAATNDAFTFRKPPSN
jgi:hypothetical protein